MDRSGSGACPSHGTVPASHLLTNAPCRNSCGADVGSLGDRAGAGWIWLVVLCLLLSNQFLDDWNILKHIETTSVANAANDSKRVSNGIDQGLVTVPFWKQLNITFKCLSGDYTPKSPIIGWCFMRTFTRPCWSTRTYVATGCPTDRHPRTATLSMGHQPSLRSTPQLASIQAPGDGVNEPMNQRIEEPMNQWISGSMNQWSNEAMTQQIKQPVNQRINEPMSEWINDWMI